MWPQDQGCLGRPTGGLKKYAKADLLSFQKKNQQAIDTLSYVLTNYKGQNIEDDALYKQAELYWDSGFYEAAEINFLNILDNHLASATKV